MQTRAKAGPLDGIDPAIRADDRQRATDGGRPGRTNPGGLGTASAPPTAGNRRRVARTHEPGRTQDCQRAVGPEQSVPSPGPALVPGRQTLRPARAQRGGRARSHSQTWDPAKGPSSLSGPGHARGLLGHVQHDKFSGPGTAGRVAGLGVSAPAALWAASRQAQAARDPRASIRSPVTGAGRSPRDGGDGLGKPGSGGQGEPLGAAANHSARGRCAEP